MEFSATKMAVALAMLTSFAYAMPPKKASPPTCQSVVPAKCKCSDEYLEIYYGCKGFTDFPSGIQSDTVALSLSRSPIKEIPAGAFDDLTQLKSFHMKLKEVTEVPAKVFDKLTELVDLSAEGTNLKSLPKDVFVKNTKLRSLTLEDMQLEEVDENLLNSLTDLRAVSLASNRLTSLPAGIFESNTQLEEIRLFGNRRENIYFVCCKIKDAIAALSPDVTINGDCVTPEGNKMPIRKFTAGADVNCESESSS